MNTVKREKYIYKFGTVELETAQMPGGTYLTMLIHPDTGATYAVETAATEAEALEQYAAIRAKFPPDAATPKTKPHPLTGKYAQLRDDIRAALEIGHQAAEQVEDTGTCNFDSPALILPRWQSAKVEQAAKEAGTGAWQWNCYGTRLWCIGCRVNGQALKNERAAEAMQEYFKANGYDAHLYCAMD